MSKITANPAIKALTGGWPAWSGLVVLVCGCTSTMPEIGQVEEPAQEVKTCEGTGDYPGHSCTPDTIVVIRHPTKQQRPRPARRDTDALLRKLQQGDKQLFCAGRRADALCRRLQKAMARYRRKRVRPLRAFLKKNLPHRPSTLLYPFSGGDVLTALSAYPNQRRYVLLSLEQGGSPTPIAHMTKKQSRRARRRFLNTSSRMLLNGFSHTTDLQEPEGKRLPGLLPLMLFGLRAHGAVITGMRTFRIEADGTLSSFSAAELAAAGQWPRREKGKPRYGRLWSDPQYNQPYSHIELRFRLPGDQTDRLLQHVAVDLSNPGLLKAPGLAPFLEQLGPHNLMIKAASYLLWKPRYADIRGLILRQATTLVADSSAPPPDTLRQQGFKVRVFGRFSCPNIRAYRSRAKHWRREFRRQKPKTLPFRFGYTDCRGQAHLVVGARRS